MTRWLRNQMMPNEIILWVFAPATATTIRPRIAARESMVGTWAASDGEVVQIQPGAVAEVRDDLAGQAEPEVRLDEPADLDLLGLCGHQSQEEKHHLSRRRPPGSHRSATG